MVPTPVCKPMALLPFEPIFGEERDGHQSECKQRDSYQERCGSAYVLTIEKGRSFQDQDGRGKKTELSYHSFSPDFLSPILSSEYATRTGPLRFWLLL